VVRPALGARPEAVDLLVHAADSRAAPAVL